MSADKSDELSEASSKDKVFDPNLESSGKMLEKVAIASAIVGGAAAITGTILIIAGSGGGGAASPEQHASRRPFLRTAVAPLFGGDLVGATAVVRF